MYQHESNEVKCCVVHHHTHQSRGWRLGRRVIGASFNLRSSKFFAPRRVSLATFLAYHKKLKRHEGFIGKKRTCKHGKDDNEVWRAIYEVSRW